MQLYTSPARILLVGEGDFSFAAALAKLRGTGAGIVATSYDSLHDVTQKYPGAADRLATLRGCGATIVHGVDATNMYMGATNMFEAVVFNFPHTGVNYRYDNSSYDPNLIARHFQSNQDLLRGFFVAARRLLVPKRGTILVAHKTLDPYDRWDIEGQARAASLCCVDRVPFNKASFPGYTPRTTLRNMCVKSYDVTNSFTYVFRPGEASPARSEMTGRNVLGLVQCSNAMVTPAQKIAHEHRSNMMNPDYLRAHGLPRRPGVLG